MKGIIPVIVVGILAINLPFSGICHAEGPISQKEIDSLRIQLDKLQGEYSKSLAGLNESNKSVQTESEPDSTIWKALILKDSINATQLILKTDQRIYKTQREFAGLNWGVGLAYTYLLSRSIDEAKLIDGKVRVSKDHKRAMALMLETHYFFIFSFMETISGLGPFAALRIMDSDGNNINGFGTGLMMGFKRQAESKCSWNIGLGYFADLNVKEFGSGVLEGGTLPGTETFIRYKTTDSGGLIIMLSSTF